MVEFQDVSKYYEDCAAIEHMTFSIPDGDFVFLVGKTGTGKSTILKLLSKQIEPSSGEITVFQLNIGSLQRKSLPYYRRLLGVIDAKTELLEDRNVFDNLALAMFVVGADEKEVGETVPRALGLVGMERKMYQFPETLSGGERLKVHIARALINNPKMILADEPTANLDYDSAWDIMRLFDEINQLGITVVISTHAQEFVDLMKKRVITLRNSRVHSDIDFNAKRPFRF
ncbi:MAG: ATP-binding cassette domain-containing protein [Bacillota bacterium]